MSRPETTDIEFEDEPYVPSNPRVSVLKWWETLEPGEKVLYRGLVLLSAGIAPWAWPIAIAVPGVVLTGLALFFLTRTTNG